MTTYKNYLKKSHLIILAFIFYYLFGLIIAGDYGISWDENVRRIASQSNIKEIAIALGIENERLDSVLSIDDNFYAYAKPTGMVYGVLAGIIEEFFNYDNTREVFQMRHKLIFSFFFISIIAFYFLAKNLFNGTNKAIFATLIYSLHPRIFAHSFFNPKDIIFLSTIPFILLAAFNFFKKQDSYNKIFLSISLGISISTRIVGLYLPILIITAYFIFKKFVQNGKPFKPIIHIVHSIQILLLSCLTSIIFIPYYWTNTIEKFIQNFLSAKNFGWSGNVYYLGEYIAAQEISWHYIFTWFIITTPIVFLFLLIFALFRLFIDLGNTFCKNFYYFKYLFGIFIPIAAAIFFKSTLYDGWRHFFFIYAFISILISYGAFELYRLIKLKNRIALKTTFLLICFFEPLYTIFSIHPHQQTYFNFFAGEDPMLNFEGDYYGTSYRQGLEYILENDLSDEILISVANSPGSLNRHILYDTDKKRLVFEYMSKENFTPDYYITNFRDSVTDYIKAKNQEEPFQNEIYSIMIKNMKILGIYKVFSSSEIN